MTHVFTIYCHTNKVNGKRYIGQTTYSMEKRWLDHVSSAKTKSSGSPVFKRAIAKYGADSFAHEILEVVGSQKECDLAELNWIDRLQSRVPNGYNLKSGGNGKGRHHEETIRRIKIGIARAKPIRSAKIRAIWAAMTPEEKLARARKTRSNSAKADISRSEKSRSWQMAQAKKRTPEQRREIVMKSWAARRLKYGDLGCAGFKKSDAHKIAWANATVEERAEHGRKVREGKRRASEAKNSRLVRINLLRAE